MFETIIGLIISGISALMSSALAGRREETSREENFALNEKAAENADKRTRQLYTDIQSPSAMLQQYKEAGLSPSMMFGGSGIGGQTSSGAQGSGSSGIQPAAFGISSPYDALTQSEIKLKKAEADNLDAQTKTINGENERGQAEINKLIQDTRNAELDEENKALENSLKQFDVAIKGATGETEIETSKLNYKILAKRLEILDEELTSAKAHAEIDDKTKDDIIAYYKKQVTEISSRILLNNANAKLARIQYKLTDKQIEKLTNDILVDNEYVEIKRGELEVNQEKLEAQIVQWGVQNNIAEREQMIEVAKIIVDVVTGDKKNNTNSILGLLAIISKFI